MKTRLLAITCALAFLTGCATRSSVDLTPFLAPCLIEGKHDSLKTLAFDTDSETLDLVVFAGNAEDAVKRCNADKASIQALTGGRR